MPDDLNCAGCRTTIGRPGCPTHRDSNQDADPTQAGRYEWSGSQLILTHCVHGLDLRLYPRCYLCRPEPAQRADTAALDVERLGLAWERAIGGWYGDSRPYHYKVAAAIAREYAALEATDD